MQEILNKSLFFMGLAVLLLSQSCDTPRPPDREQSHVLDRPGFSDYRPDTSILYQKNGRDYLLRVPVWVARTDLPPILDLMREYPNGIEDSTRTYPLDVTGDGNKEIVTEEIWFRDEEYFTSLRIQQGESTIWADTLPLDLPVIANLIWEDPDAFMEVYPWSGFYYTFLNFPKWQTDLSPYIYDPKVIGMEMMRRGVSPMEEGKYQAETEKFQSEMRNFKGNLLVRESPTEPGIWIWSKRFGQFVEFWAPEEEIEANEGGLP